MENINSPESGYRYLFSWITEEGKQKNKHQFHYHKKGYPTNQEFEIWFFSKIFSPILIEKDDSGIYKSVLYSNRKAQQIKDFLDFHFQEFKGQKRDFIFEIEVLWKQLPNHNIDSVFRSHYEPTCNVFKEWIHEKKRAIEKGEIKPNKSRTENSFHWQGSAGELSELYQKLITNKLIANDTSEADFKAIFEAKPLEEIIPVRWMQKPVLLAYFIVKLRDKIPFNDNIWKIAESCFQPAKHLKQSAANYQNNKSQFPNNHHLVDMLFR